MQIKTQKNIKENMKICYNIVPRKFIDISAQRDIIKEKKVLESKTYSSAIKAGKSIKTM